MSFSFNLASSPPLSRRAFLRLTAQAAAATALGAIWIQQAQTLPSASLISGIWSGGLGTTTARVVLRPTDLAQPLRLHISQSPTLTAPIVTPYYLPAIGTRTLSIGLSGLQPHTRYYVAAATASTLDDEHILTFTTPADGPFSFKVALGSCAYTGSNHTVFDTIRSHNPFLFLQTGDFHYRNIAVNDPTLFRDAFDLILSTPRPAALLRQVPVAYIWDDHDYGANDSDSTSPSRPAARQVYREFVPHYPLPAGSSGAVYQAFAIGRVYFILTDGRSEKTPASAPDNGAKSVLGSEQKAWLKEQLLWANGRFPLIFWVNSIPWISPPVTGADHWGGYTTERAELANFITSQNIQGLAMLSGDAHMLAIDDGRNNNFSSSSGPGFPVFHAAALDQTGSVKGGPYSHGTYPGGGQFGLVHITDTGGNTIDVRWEGRRDDNTLVVSHQFQVSAPAPTPTPTATPTTTPTATSTVTPTATPTATPTVTPAKSYLPLIQR